MTEDKATYPFWIGEPDANGTRRIGLSEAWLESTVDGHVVSLDLLAEGQALRRGDSIGMLHTNLRAHDLRMPWAATIRRRNVQALANAALVRLSPYGSGWLAEVVLAED